MKDHVEEWQLDYLRSSPQLWAASCAFSARYATQNAFHSLVRRGDGTRIFQWTDSHDWWRCGHATVSTDCTLRYDLRHGTQVHVRLLIAATRLYR